MKIKLFLGILMVIGFMTNISAANHSHLHVVLLGDSNTFIGGEDCDKNRGWSKWFKERFSPSTCKSYARSGATWTNCSKTKINTEEYSEKLTDNNVIFNQVLRLIQATKEGKEPQPDLIMIMAGTNDAWFKSSRPQLFFQTPQQVFSATSNTVLSKPIHQVTSLAESVRYSCEKIKEAFPDAQIVLITPMQIGKPGVTGIHKIGDIIEECGHYMSLSVIRLDYEGTIQGAREINNRIFTTDGVHTNSKGAKRNGYFIANQLESLLLY